MSTPYQYVATTGLIVPDTSDILTGVQQEWQSIFGTDLSVTNDTPQGKLITAEASARSGVATNNTQVANQINPNYSGGVWLDAICAWLLLDRTQATYTLVPQVAVAGQPLTILPAGSLAKGQSTGELFATLTQVQFDNSGNAVVDFQCIDAGPIACPHGDLQVQSQVFGWETVNNQNDAVFGVAEQSDVSLRQLRRNTLAKNAISAVEAQTSGLTLVPGVLSFQFRENVAATTQTIDGIVMVAHSVYACVDGGTDADVAASLLKSKTVGAAWNGAVSVPVVEPASGQTYDVLFDRPTKVPMLCRVTVRQGSSTQDLPTTLPAYVVNYAEGQVVEFAEDGTSQIMPGFVVGANVSPWEISNALKQQAPGIQIVKVEVASVAGGSGTYSTSEFDIATNGQGTITASSVTVIVTT